MMEKRKGYVFRSYEEDDRILEYVARMKSKRSVRYVADAGNLTTEEHLSFSIFQRGEIAALAGLDSSECPFHEERDVRLREIWYRGFVYGCREGEE